MKTKYLLTALALPAMFAACSQEDVLSNENMLQSTDVLGKIAGDVAFNFDSNSRLVWGATGNAAWEANDEFSLFWVNSGMTAFTENTSLDGNINALYKKDGSTFTSENILYEGKHLMVYPVDKAHISNKDIVVKVASLKKDDANVQIQDASVELGKRSVYTNDSLLTIAAMPEDAEDMVDGVIYAAGYKQPVQAMVKPLSSNLVLNLNFDMPSTISEVTVKSVSLVADEAIFPANGSLTATNDSVGFKAGDLTKEIVLNLPAETKVTNNDEPYVAQISLLPISANTATKYQIKVTTNYGVVTIDSAKYVTDKNGLYLSLDNTAEKQAAENFKIGKAPLNLAAEFALTNENGSVFTYRGNEIELPKEQESFGKRITANVTVKMSEASISNMKVSNSQELIDAYNTYTLLAKTDAESFILSNANPFEMTPEAVAKVLSNTKVTLTQELNDTIKLVGAHTAIPSFKVKNGSTTTTLFNTADTKLVLGAEGTWALDVKAAAAANTWKTITNDGTLTLTESNPENAVEISKPIVNRGTVNFNGNVTVGVSYYQFSGTTNVPTGSDVTMKKTADFKAGLLNVAGILDADGNTNITTIQKDAVVEVSGRFRSTDNGNITNLGTIKIKDENATAIITENGKSSANGSIELINRDDLVSVSGTNKGHIKWICTETTLKKAATDVFNYIIVKKNLTIDSASDDIDHVEVDATARITTATAGEKFKSLFVNAGNTMIIPTASKVTVTEKFVLDGDVEVLGDFDYSAASKTGKGDVFYRNN